MDDTSLKEYFVFSFQKKNEKPLFSIKINKKFKRTKIISKKTNLPFSSSQIEYFHQFGFDKTLADSLFEFRKRFFNIQNCLNFFKCHNLLTSEEILFCEKYIEISNAKMKKNILKKFRQLNIEKNYLKHQIENYNLFLKRMHIKILNLKKKCIDHYKVNPQNKNVLHLIMIGIKIVVGKKK